MCTKIDTYVKSSIKTLPMSALSNESLFLQLLSNKPPFPQNKRTTLNKWLIIDPLKEANISIFITKIQFGTTKCVQKHCSGDESPFNPIPGFLGVF